MLKAVLTASGLLGILAAPVLGNSFPSWPVYPSFHSPQRDSQLTTFDAPGATDTEAEGINASGVIVGYYAAKQQYGFVRSANGKFAKFQVKGSTGTYPLAINNSGAVTGSYNDSAGTPHGFVRAADGTITKFDPTGSAATNPLQINASGSVVGSYGDKKFIPSGFIRNASGEITTVDVAGAKGTQVWCINDKGAVAGDYLDSKGAYHGFIRSPGGKFTNFDVPGAGTKRSQGTYVYGINEAGVVSGYFFGGTGKRNSGFVRAADGTITVFDPEGSVATYLGYINGTGAITGFYLPTPTTIYGYVRAANGTISEFSAPEAAALGTRATGINSKSVVVGTYYDENNNGHGFTRTP